MSTMRPRSHSTDFTMPSLSRTNELIVSNNSHEEQFILVDEPPSPTTPTPSTSAFVILGRGGQIESSEGCLSPSERKHFFKQAGLASPLRRASTDREVPGFFL
ncbi:hypothetical protein EMIHUDRAFT_446154 [Emiliania huxleyi CCMP1516]|uniref:Uncharacterized protein n=3 Tax=Emiliania huxleyi TaxID=2903 RepID=A0A0D3IIA8_EMIH1|nr:hypothetical protein EMIHUDRAFT_446154 [Emiliania huxleyi CCMP1516]EOD10993.1 hypothetical protein EMIHUDRAFT_446154 [Emiliania huxleyi CCMP1516]|eukprot:XP_005763422.1 hypothetical protein EMIHUDRAFT_446154 [Emiliania huxleyi CCMP1516]